MLPRSGPGIAALVFVLVLVLVLVFVLVVVLVRDHLHVVAAYADEAGE